MIEEIDNGFWIAKRIECFQANIFTVFQGWFRNIEFENRKIKSYATFWRQKMKEEICHGICLKYEIEKKATKLRYRFGQTKVI